MRIIPAIDIMGGKCVRLTQGDYTQKQTYSADPLEVARTFEDSGLHYLHLVDLDGARAQRVINWAVLERLSSETALRIDFGGGIKSDDDLRKAFECGAQQVVVGSVAARQPQTFLRWLSIYGPGKLILGADARNGRIATDGWLEQTTIEVTQFIDDFAAKGVQYVISTDIAKDGMLSGTALALYRQIIDTTPDIDLIASGGISSVADINALREMGVEGAIVGKAIYEGKLNLRTLADLC
jgi:phosphoribosylformimino-5-aminoimidazole carboxamide ribotide isomerase